MPIAVSCPKCGATFRVKDKYAGSTRGCLECGATIWVPTANTTVAEDRATRDDIEAPITAARETKRASRSTARRSATPEAPADHAFADSLAQDRDVTPSPGGDRRIRFYCTGCGKRLKVKSRYAGEQTKCGACGAVVDVPPAMQAPSTRAPDVPRAGPAPPPAESSEPLGASLVSEGFDELLDDKIEVRRELPHGYKVTAPQAARTPVVQMRPKKKRRRKKAENGDGSGWTLGGYLKYRLIISGVGFLCVGIMYLAAHFGFDIRPSRLVGQIEEHPALRVAGGILDLDRQCTTLLQTVRSRAGANQVANRYADLMFRRKQLVAQEDTLIGQTISGVEDVMLNRLYDDQETAASAHNAEFKRIGQIPGCDRILFEALANRGVVEEDSSTSLADFFSCLPGFAEEMNIGVDALPRAIPPEIPNFNSTMSQSTPRPYEGTRPSFSNRQQFSPHTNRLPNRGLVPQGRASHLERQRLDSVWEEAQTSDERLELALTEFRSASAPSRLRAMKELAEISPVDERRAEIVEAVRNSLGSEDTHLQQVAIGVFMDWHQGDTVGMLLDVIRASKEPSARSALIETVGTFEDERIADALASLLASPVDRRAAGNALRQIGSSAERAVLRQLRKPDPGLQREACEILAEIGTPRSLSALRRLRRSRSSFLSQPAGSAIFAIELREGDDGGSPAPAAASDSKVPDGR